MRRVIIYGAVWLLATIAALALRLTMFAHTEDRFALGVVYMMGTWLPLMALHVYEAGRVRSRLGDRYETLRRKPSWATPWFLSDQELRDDPELAPAIRDHRDLQTFTLIVFCSYFVMAPALVF